MMSRQELSEIAAFFSAVISIGMMLIGAFVLATNIADDQTAERSLAVICAATVAVVFPALWSIIYKQLLRNLALCPQPPKPG